MEDFDRNSCDNLHISFTDLETEVVGGSCIEGKDGTVSVMENDLNDDIIVNV